MPLSGARDQATMLQWTASLLNSTSENAVVMLSVEGTILGWLGAASLLFGYSADEAVGMPLARLFTTEDVEARLDAHERELALSAGRSEDDRWHVRRDGSRFWGSGVMEPVRDADGSVLALVKVLRDRTDVRTQVVALRNRLAASEEQNLRRMESLTTIAHELRNQVSPLANLLSVLEKTNSGQAVNAGMRRQVDMLTRLIDDLVEDAAVATSTPSMVFAEVEVQALVQHSMHAMRKILERRAQAPKVTLPKAPIVIEADPHRVNQMLVNLIGNASKFTPVGGSIQVSATVEDDMVAIRVEDDGEGIPADVLPKIFELFSRESRPGSPAGIGVGLTVVKSLAELHGGFVEGRSPGRGKGSVFTVRLPLVRRG
ncbi:MAG: PAS domain-containing sensor histidine kinase [Burkholderiaceae bacterium]